MFWRYFSSYDVLRVSERRDNEMIVGELTLKIVVECGDTRRVLRLFFKNNL